MVAIVALEQRVGGVQRVLSEIGNTFKQKHISSRAAFCNTFLGAQTCTSEEVETQE